MRGDDTTFGAADRSRPFRIETIDDLAKAIALNERAGAIGTAHLQRALLTGRCCAWQSLPDESAGRIKRFIRASAPRPSLILIGDDDGFDRGPGGWSQAERIAKWCAAVLIHAAAAEVAHYESAIQAAAIVKRVAIVECSTIKAAAWIDLFRSVPNRPKLMFIRPPIGVAHPAPVDRTKLQ